jgi:hypothetical protein
MAVEIYRRQSRSETVDYSEPAEIHDRSRLRTELVPLYIGDGFAVKIIRYDKQSGWDQTAISMQLPAARRLHEALGEHLAIAA